MQTRTITRPRIQRTTHIVEEDQGTTLTPHAYAEKEAIFRVYQIVWYILALVEIFLGFRFAFRAIGANPFTLSVNFIYNVTNPLVFPFSGIVRNYVYGITVLEWSTLIAAVVYALIAWGIVYLFQLVKPTTPEEVEEEVDNP